MIPDGFYRYYQLDDEGRRTPKGSIKIANQELQIVSDPKGILSAMFEEGPVNRKTLDVIRSVNRNHYAVFVKEIPKSKKQSSENTSDQEKSFYTEKAQESVEKGEFGDKLKAGAIGLAVAASTALTPTQSGLEQYIKNPAQETKIQPAKANKEKERILASIMDVESSGGKNVEHEAPHFGTMHGKERAYGKYGLMPITIRETIKRNPNLMNKHSKAINLMGSDLHNYMDKNPGLEDAIANSHYDRLSKHFGNDPVKIARAWIGGITGTKTAIKNGEDISKHWHVVKVKRAYDQRKKK